MDMQLNTIHSRKRLRARLNRQSNRLQGYDYSQQGMYFITLCVDQHKCLFGTIIDDVMVLSRFGMIARDEWVRTANIRAEIEIDACVVMPNHLHGIVLINSPDGGLGRAAALPYGIGLQCKSISSLVAGFKSVVTKRINAIRRTPGAPVWQRNYYDHIIRNEESLTKIREYVINNPLTWKKDKLYSQ